MDEQNQVRRNPRLINRSKGNLKTSRFDFHFRGKAL